MTGYGDWDGEPDETKDGDGEGEQEWQHVRICDSYDFFAPRINALTYFTYLPPKLRLLIAGSGPRCKAWFLGPT